MAVVVEQTIPFPTRSLHLEDPERWSKLLPLIRPTIARVSLPSGQTALVDLANSHRSGVQIAVISTSGNFPSKVFSHQPVAAVVVQQGDSRTISAKHVAAAVKSEGAVLIIRSGKQRRVVEASPDLLDFETDGDLELDHLLQILSDIKPTELSTVDRLHRILDLFVSGASTTRSIFQAEKVDDFPAVVHADGHAAYEKAQYAVVRDLRRVLRAKPAQEGTWTYSVHYSDVNGLSRLENYILGQEVAKFLDAQSIPFRLSSSSVLLHDNLARGFAISICPIPESLLPPQVAPLAPLNQESTSSSSASATLNVSKMSFTDSTVRARITSACNAVIAAEPTITKYDEIVGDGDCGYTLRDGAKQVLSFIGGKDLSALPQTLSELVHDLEVNMGGTSGALYCIFLTSLSSSLATEVTVAGALKVALEQLMRYTRARLGDRTMLDCLIPFVDTLGQDGTDVNMALAEARKGVDGTKELKASLGRSTYLDESATKGVPDPGAYGLLILLDGMCKVE